MTNQGQRNPKDFYQTPKAFTKLLLDNEYFNKDFFVFEPACGNGAIVDVLKENGYPVIGADKEMGDDFLVGDFTSHQLITNPPFSLAKEFILQAKKLVSWKFALLLPLNYLSGQWRYENIFSDKEFPLAKVYVMTRMPMLSEELREDGKFKTGMQVYAWMVWEKNWTGEPVIRWLDIQPWVYSKRKDK